MNGNDQLSHKQTATTARTLKQKGPMEADLLSSIGTSNRCTIGSSVHGVVVVGDLLRRHRLMMVRGKAQAGGETEWRVLYSVRMVRCPRSSE